MSQTTEFPDRLLTPVCAAMIHRIAGADPVARQRMLIVLDAPDPPHDRRTTLHLAERDAWKTVELLLLRRLIERRLREGELDVWARITPGGGDLLTALREEYGRRAAFGWPSEPEDFDVRALLELRSARLAGELSARQSDCAEVAADPVEGSTEIVREFASRLGEAFPYLAQVVLSEDVGVVTIATDMLNCRLRADEATRAAFGPVAGAVQAASSPAAPPLARLLLRSPELVEELIGDVLADSALRQRRRVEAARLNSKPVTEEEARAEVMKLLGQSEVIEATTLADAVAQAERLKETHNILLAMNSLWGWYSTLPPDEQRAIGTFGGKRPHIQLWTAARLRVRREEPDTGS